MILARLRRAIQEQNWFAVVLEVCIVVLGVVIGFQITAWGGARADRAQEQVYLCQLADDLRETERRVAEIDSMLLPLEKDSGSLQRAFYTPTRPPRDSLLAWILGSGIHRIVSAVTGTAEALVATGDLGLIRDDSLRSAITTYLGNLEARKEELPLYRAVAGESHQTIRSGRDYSAEYALLLERYDVPTDYPLYPLPVGPRRRVAPLDVEAFLSDPAMESAVADNIRSRIAIKELRQLLLEWTVALREQVEAEIER